MVQFSINDALAQGYTVEVFATSSDYDFELMVRPDTDYDDTFRAYCINSSEWLDVNGWLFTIEEMEG